MNAKRAAMWVGWLAVIVLCGVLWLRLQYAEIRNDELMIALSRAATISEAVAQQYAICKQTRNCP